MTPRPRSRCDGCWSSRVRERCALAAFAEVDPDALVADIDLDSSPDGIELATALRRIAPHLGVVFLTAC
ncbi:hypothetical protein BMH32_02425 [Leucobacter sp. OLJS4]|uniref:response regulator transcription factor n=1 Tax=unclassified Leucobacter TaxID=2621730 RepID=UPI000C1930E3|nr:MULTISPECIES: response regulator [unclassified Leucobacter]PIJ06025.1 hypothetical protein BMH30_14405 [Leucobacter sp. OLES1]PII81380.1 hypothetical protein BMH25_12550 [Leucobacter sp. OLCALW19]PII86048.1 hypothetical protein BMH26_12965 [Leucobacter sp. OLTLW20]PII89944.1 hypothetical protein BMH27_11130 [Leucobacter sp. OLAS13]PII96975.1 hypothetical protein BMH29_11815 [Leucobacter sp. OLDS2]